MTAHSNFVLNFNRIYLRVKRNVIRMLSGVFATFARGKLISRKVDAVMLRQMLLIAALFTYITMFG